MSKKQAVVNGVEPNIDFAQNPGRNITEKRLWWNSQYRNNKAELEKDYPDLKVVSSRKVKNEQLAQALTTKLNQYIEDREENDSSYTTPLGLGGVLSFFGLAHPKDVKIKATEKLIKLLNPHEQISENDRLMPHELSALRHGDLGKISNKPIYAAIVTAAMQRYSEIVTECKI